MSIVAVSSLRGAPGATTLALALAATWPGGDVTLVEADADGGSIASNFDLPDTGLVDLVAAARRGPAPLAERAAVLPGGLRAVTAPSSPTRASATLRHADALVASLTASTDTVVLDAGRLVGRDPHHPLLAAAAAVVVVVRPRIDHVRSLVDVLSAVAPHGADDPAVHRLPRLAVIGRQPYSADDVASVTGCPLLMVVPDDPVAASLLTGTRGTTRSLSRTALVRVAAAAAQTLADDLDRARAG